MSIIAKAPILSPVFATYLRRKAPEKLCCSVRSNSVDPESYIFDLMDNDDQLSIELRYIINDTKLYRYALYSNSFINSNLSLFELDNEDDLSDIAYAYMKTHTYISNTIYIMLRNEMNKRGMKYLSYSSISDYSYTAMHKWAYDFKRFVIKADGESGIKTIETILNFISLFHLDDRDIHETTIYAYITDMKIWRFLRQFVEPLHYEQITDTCKSYILDMSNKVAHMGDKVAHNTIEIFIEPLEGYEDEFRQRIFDGTLNAILKEHNINVESYNSTLGDQILLRINKVDL